MRCAALACSVLIAGCAVGPDFRRPSPPPVERYTPEPLATESVAAQIPGGAMQRFVRDLDIPGQWWTLYRSPALNSLVAQALRANPTLQSAQAALRVAEENHLASRGALFPSADASFSTTRQKSAPILSSPLNTPEPVFNLHTAQLSIAYVPDVFGGVRRQVEAAAALAESQRCELEATYVTLSSNVVAAAVQEAALRAQIAATEEIVKLETEQVALMQRQYELGAIAEANVIAQRVTLAQAQATLAPLRKQLAQQRNLLTALAGRFPSDEVAERFDFANLELPVELPVSLPSKLVEQRPDVRAAEAQLHAASAEVGVAVANMLPQFSISANIGSVASEIGSLLGSGSGFWLVGVNATQPLFHGSTLLHRKRAAQAAYEQAAAQYRATVIAALQNVADTLRALQYDAIALKAALDAKLLAEESLAIARRQLELGDISYLGLLTAEQAYQQTVLALVQAQANRYADTAALFQALGGGWWNARPAETKG
ncbi:MAG TPA: efflux transporter outer membrane subunit [Burkholderiales bacterium]|nr:efflux transporter outer membrane subunit [Burkholderiales bacterium]